LSLLFIKLSFFSFPPIRKKGGGEKKKKKRKGDGKRHLFFQKNLNSHMISLSLQSFLLGVRRKKEERKKKKGGKGTQEAVDAYWDNLVYGDSIFFREEKKGGRGDKREKKKERTYSISDHVLNGPSLVSMWPWGREKKKKEKGEGGGA